MTQFKKLLCTTLIFLFSSEIHSQNVLDEWEQRLLKYDPDFKQFYENHQLGQLNLRDSQDAWLPQISFEPAYDLAKTTGASGLILSHQGRLGLSVGQQLPLGAKLSGQFTQVMVIQGDNPVYQYGANGSLSLITPILLWYIMFNSDIYAPLFISRSIDEELMYYSWKGKRLEIVAQTLGIFLDGLLEIRVQSNREKLEKWHLQNNQGDQILWAKGQISNIELSESTRLLNETIQNALQGRKKLLEKLNRIQSWGFSPQDETVEKWLDKWEMLPPEEDSAAHWNFLAKEKQLEKSRITIVNQEITKQPQLSINYSYTPGPIKGSRNGFSAAFEEYWARDLRWDWTLSASFRWPVVPWDPLYHTSESTNTQLNILKAQETNLAFIKKQWIELFDLSNKLIDQRRNQAFRRLKLEEDRLELLNLKFQAGQVATSDLEYQKIQVEDAEIELLRIRIERVLFYINGQ